MATIAPTLGGNPPLDLAALIAQILGQQQPQARMLPQLGSDAGILPPGMSVPPVPQDTAPTPLPALAAEPPPLRVPPLAPRPLLTSAAPGSMLPPSPPAPATSEPVPSRLPSASELMPSAGASPVGATPPTLAGAPPMASEAELSRGILNMGALPGAPMTLTGEPVRAPLGPPRSAFRSADDLMGGIRGMGTLPVSADVAPVTVTAEPGETPVDGTATVQEGQAPAAARGPSAAAPAPAAGTSGGRQQRGLGDYALAFLSGLSGEGGLASVRRLSEGERAQNATYNALVQKGASPELAEAMTLNPGQFAAVLPSLFTPRTQIVNNRLVDLNTGRTIVDFSDAFRPVPEGTAGILNQATGAVTPTPELPRKPRDLSPGDIRTLRNEGSILSNVRRAIQGFQDRYAVPLVGSIRTAAGRNLPEWATTPDAREAARWWQDYDRSVGLIERHELFGAALTATEQAAWRAADIAPTMNPENIRANLATRERILSNAMRRYARSLVADRYNAEAVSEAFGVPPAELGISEGGRRDSLAAPGAGAGDWVELAPGIRIRERR